MQRREHGVGRLSFGPRNSDWSDGLLLDVEPKHVAILGPILGGTKNHQIELLCFMEHDGPDH